MSTADADDPNYLKPAPGFGHAPMTFCKHENIAPCPERGEKAQYQCVDCQHPFPESLIEERDGKLQQKSFSEYSGRPGKSRR